MLFKSLKYTNFRQFKGENKVEFATDKEKNVTVILGDNTFGKTTLLQMFNWCLYNKVLFDKEDNPDFLLNLEVSKQMRNGEQEKVEVEIVLVHQNIEYTISRKQVYAHVNGETSSYPSMLDVSYKKLDTGETDSVKNTDKMKNVINTILPEDLSGFFFFDTERVRNVAHRKDLSDAVKGLLGLKTIDNARKHLGKEENKTSVIGSFYVERVGLAASDKKTKFHLNKIDENVTILERERNNLENLDNEIEKYEESKEELSKKILALEETTKLQLEKEKLEKYVESDKRELEEIYGDYLKLFSTNVHFFFARPLYQQALSFLEKADIDDKGVKDVTADTIHELIKNGKCLCGTEICEGNEAYFHLMEQIKFVPPESIGTTISNFKKEIKRRDSINNNDAFFGSVQNYLGRIKRKNESIEEKRERIQDIESEIIGKEGSKKYQLQLNEVKVRLRDLSLKRDSCMNKIATAETEINHHKRQCDLVSAKTDKIREIEKYMTYAKAVKKWFDEYYYEEEEQIRNDLEKKVNEIFDRMYHGERTLKIDSRYNITLYTKVEGSEEEIITGTSEGLNRVKNFAFIAGLVEIAKNQIKKIGNEEVKGEPYPLILDAPFSNADAVHTKNISIELPKAAEQVIMFVMEKDWNYAKEVINSKVGKQYMLNKHTDTYSTIE